MSTKSTDIRLITARQTLARRIKYETRHLETLIKQNEWRQVSYQNGLVTGLALALSFIPDPAEQTS